MRGRTGIRLVTTAIVAALALLLAPLASAARLPHFSDPAPGQIELIALVFQVKFSHQAPPAKLPLSVKRSLRPSDFGLLMADERTSVHSHVADYMLLVEALRAKRVTTASDAEEHDALGQILSILADHGFHGYVRSSTLNDLIDVQQDKTEDLFVNDNGVADPGNLDTGNYDDGHAFGWTKAKEQKVWGASWDHLSDFTDGADIKQVVEQIESAVGHDDEFEGVPPASTPGGNGSCSGSATTGSRELAPPPNPSAYGETLFPTAIPASCKEFGGNPPVYSAYLINDATGKLINCHQPAQLQPPPGQQACPQQDETGVVSGSGGHELANPPMLVLAHPSDKTWTLEVATYGATATPPTASAHIVYDWKT